MEWFCYVKGFFALLFMAAEVFMGATFFIFLAIYTEKLFDYLQKSPADGFARAAGFGVKWIFFVAAGVVLSVLVAVLVYASTEAVCHRGFWSTVIHLGGGK